MLCERKLDYRHRLIVYHAVGTTRTAVRGFFESLVKRSGTHCQMNLLRDPACDIDSFKQFFETILLSQYKCDRRIRG